MRRSAAAIHDVIAQRVGTEELAFEVKRTETRRIDIEWRHRQLGDLFYPPGTDASGGRYRVVPKPPDGYPYVPRYKTDTCAIEFIESA